MADLDCEKENLANFLLSHSKLNSSITPKGLEINVEDVSVFALAEMVKKFVYHKNLNSSHWVTVESNVVKIQRFKHQKKSKVNKHPVTPSIIKHGW
jgi:hypothetical protein